MAWRCTGKTNSELISNLAMNGIFNSQSVASAMNKVDRANYVLHKSQAYEDSPQVIGFGATISAPHMHAYASEHLLPYLRPGAKVLDVGSGSGYLVAVLHQLVSPGGKVVGIEHVDELVEWSKENLKKDGLGAELESKSIQIITGDGRKGYANEGPYDAIHVGAAAPTIPPALVDQLASPGRLFIPVGTSLQNILHVDKDAEGNISEKEIMSVRYVPLTDRDIQS
ncbi:protein-L-isoaspartate O-methyltransferase [Marasmius fiardii PR-910]|nr:protein-L-isoaspartate O-methyltransferase [Marasmius fiardii PR-910]